MPEEHAWIEMSDGVKLATSLYLPETEPPWPVVLEALPYRKDDVTASYTPEYRRLRDEGDLAVARIDVRGTGSSEGIAIDEYPAQEQRDMCEAIAWLAAQPWSNGSVGMYGTSYSGFNSIQVAMERPEALKAIVAIYATDDRYTDDVHYEGGAKRGLDSIDYPLYMVAMNALPPVPALAGEGWRDQWAERVEKLEPWLLRWLEEQSDGPYWRHGSLRPDYDRIECATMIVAGWADGYRNATFRVFEELDAPKRLLFGPWSHASPESALPGPHIDLVPEMIRWWNRWLRDDANGIDEEPPITLFARRSTKLEPDGAEVRGDWRYEPGWPLDRVHTERWELDDAQRPLGAVDTLEVRGDVGVTASISCAGLLPFGQPFDQRPDEAYSLVYDFGELDEELEILGYPTLEVTVTATAPVAFLSAKLCDVFEDGTSILVSRGFLNLTRRDSLTDPQPLEPGRAYRVVVELDVTSWTFEPGHRVRLDLAGSDWPNVWPPPQPVTLTIDPGESSLELPIVRGPSPIADPPALHPPPPAPTKASTTGDSSDTSSRPITWRSDHDILARQSRVVIDHGSSASLEIGGRMEEHYFGHCAASSIEPGDASAEGGARYRLEWPEGSATSEVQMNLASDETTYKVTLELSVGENDAVWWTRRWERDFPRRLL